MHLYFYPCGAQALSNTVVEKGAALRELIEQELEQFVANRAQVAWPPFTLEGGELRVTARATRPLFERSGRHR